MIFTTNRKVVYITRNWTYDISAKAVYRDVRYSSVDVFICSKNNCSMKTFAKDIYKERQNWTKLFREIYKLK